MSQKALITNDTSEFEPIVQMVLDGLGSENSKRVYRKAVQEFLGWWALAGKPILSKALVQRYRVEVLEYMHTSSASINQKLSAVKKLAQEGADNGLLPHDKANGISKVRGAPAKGVRVGNWLTREQAQALINTPDTTLLKGLRDRAILALMIGAGLRRDEVSRLEFVQVVQREGRWIILDLKGKAGRVRSVPIPAWAKQAIDAWAQAAGINSGRIFRGVYHYGHTLQPESEGMTSQAVYLAVRDAARAAGLDDIAPHDLRRTFARLARKGGAELTQIQLSLGHASVQTTQKYISEEQNLTSAPCDFLGFDLQAD